MMTRRFQYPHGEAPNYSGEQGARRLAHKVGAYWRARGAEAVEVVAVCIDGLWTVQSNLFNGLPPLRRRDLVSA